MKKIIATLFGAGWFPWMPGTFASALAVPLAVTVHVIGGFPILVAATIGLFLVGWWSVAQPGANDPAEFVIDELAGQFIAIWPYSAWLWMREIGVSANHWPILIGALLLFRFFDIVKPWPISAIDERHDSLSIMLDDVAAGIAAAAFLAAALLILEMT